MDSSTILREDLSYRVEENGNAGWSWEVVSLTRGTVASGVADSEIEARADALRAGQEVLSRPVHHNGG